MLDLGTLQIGVKVDDGKAKASLLGLADSASKAEGRFAKLKGGLTAFAKGAGIVAGIVAAAVVGIKKLADEVAEYGDAVDKNSQKMGISAEAYQKWDYVLQRNGTSINALKTGMKTFTSQMESGSEAFDKLGVSTKKSDGSFRDTEEVLNDSIIALAGVEDQTERTALANELFGKRTAQELLPMLNSGADGIEDLQKRAEELGFVMSDETVKACAEYEDAMTDVQMSTMGLRNNILSGLIPVMADLASNLSEKIGYVSTVVHEEVEKNGAKGILTAIGRLAEEAGNKLAEMAPKILAKMAELATSLGEYMAKAIPKALSKIGDLGNKLADAIGSKGGGKLMKKAGEIMLTLGRGLVKAIPKMLGSAANIITALANKIGSGGNSKMISAGLSLIKKLAVGIIKALPQLAVAAGKLIIALAKAIITHIPDILKIGLDIVDAIVSGIGQGFSKLLTAGADIVKGIFSGIFQGLGNDAEGLSSAFGKMKKPFGLAQESMEGLRKAWSGILGQKGKKKYSVSQSKIKDTAAKAKDLFNKWKAVLAQAGSKTFKAIKSGFSSFVKGATEVFNKWKNVLGQAASKTFTIVRSGFSSFISSVGSILSKWKEILRQKASKTFTITRNETTNKTTHGKRVGLREVPYDGYLSELHKGEVVLTANEANQYRKWLNRKPEAEATAAQVQTIESGNTYTIYIDGTRINDDAQIESKFGDLMFDMARRGLM